MGVVGDVVRELVERQLGTTLTSALEENFAETINELNSSILDDALNLERVTLALSRLHDCRLQIARDVNRDVRRGLLTRARGEADLQLLRDLTNEDLELAREVIDDIGDRSEEFRLAARQARTQARTPAQIEKVEEIDAAIQTNQNAFEASTTEVAAIETSAAGDDFELAWARLLWRVALARETARGRAAAPRDGGTR